MLVRRPLRRTTCEPALRAHATHGAHRARHPERRLARGLLASDVDALGVGELRRVRLLGEVRPLGAVRGRGARRALRAARGERCVLLAAGERAGSAEAAEGVGDTHVAPSGHSVGAPYHG